MKNVLITGANGQLGNEMRLLGEKIQVIIIISQMLRSWIYAMKRLLLHI